MFVIVPFGIQGKCTRNVKWAQNYIITQKTDYPITILFMMFVKRFDYIFAL